jgi:hypothetical protein
MGQDADSAKVTLRGIVVPTEWGDDGEVQRVAIHTFDEGQYDVIADSVGRRLAGFLRDEVQALVRLEETGGDRHRARVLSFTVFDTACPVENVANAAGSGESCLC